MKDLSKWIYRICIVLLIVMAIDINSDWLRSTPKGSRFVVIDLILGGLLALLLIFPKIKRRQ